MSNSVYISCLKACKFELGMLVYIFLKFYNIEQIMNSYVYEYGAWIVDLYQNYRNKIDINSYVYANRVIFPK